MSVWRSRDVRIRAARFRRPSRLGAAGPAGSLNKPTRTIPLIGCAPALAACRGTHRRPELSSSDAAVAHLAFKRDAVMERRQFDHVVVVVLQNSIAVADLKGRAHDGWLADLGRDVADLDVKGGRLVGDSAPSRSATAGGAKTAPAIMHACQRIKKTTIPINASRGFVQRHHWPSQSNP